MRLAVVALLALVLAAPALASEQHPTLARARRAADVPDLRGRDARAVGFGGGASGSRSRSSTGSLQARRAARSSTSSSRSGATRILAAPPRHGFDLLAWLLPIVGVLAGAAVLGVLAWRWTREREPEPAPDRWSLNGHPLGPDEERRLDEELARFDG